MTKAKNSYALQRAQLSPFPSLEATRTRRGKEYPRNHGLRDEKRLNCSQIYLNLVARRGFPLGRVLTPHKLKCNVNLWLLFPGFP
jgi:hypothetical protein